MTTWREELRALVEARPDSELPDVIGELARANAVAIQRLQRRNENGDRPAPGPQKYLTAREVHERYGVSTKWAYAHERELGAERFGRSVRFPEKKVRRYLEAHRC